MKKDIMLGTIGVFLLISSCTFYKIYAKTTTKSNSIILAKVGDYKITQDNLNEEKKDSQFSMQGGKTFTDKEILDKMVTDKLLLIEAKQLNINLSDEEVREIQKQMEYQMNWTGYHTGEFKGLTTEQFQVLKEDLEINEVKIKLGANLDETLDELRNNTTIIYYR